RWGGRTRMTRPLDSTLQTPKRMLSTDSMQEPRLCSKLIILIPRMKLAHVIDGIGASAPGDPSGAGRVRQSFKGGGTPVPDPIRAVAPAESSRESLWGGPRRKKHPTPPIYGT